VIIAQCGYGYSEMKKAGVDVNRFIYHGIDPSVFYPIKNFDDYIDKNIDANEIISMLKLAEIVMERQNGNNMILIFVS